MPTKTTHPGSPRHSAFSWRRLYALCRKETYQISRDASTIIIAFVLPIVMLLIYGYGLNLDTGRTRIGLICEDASPDAREFAASLTGSPYLNVFSFDSPDSAAEALARSHIRGFVTIPTDFSAKLRRAETYLVSSARQTSTSSPYASADFSAPIQVITDGSEPNTANFVQAYVTGAWQNWMAQRAAALGQPVPSSISVEQTFWYNPTASSRNYLIPGSVTIIMTVIGALLTALVVAREWERGTMEALLASPVTRLELLLSKIIPYYVLGIIILLICSAFGHFVLGVPFRGSLPMLLACGSMFLLSVLGMGLLISTVTRNQFNAAQVALLTAFLPALMLSGFVFETTSMPSVIRFITNFIPARYFVTAMQTLFQAGNVWYLLLRCLIFLTGTSILFIGLTAKFTRKRLD